MKTDQSDSSSKKEDWWTKHMSFSPEFVEKHQTFIKVLMIFGLVHCGSCSDNGH